MFLDSSTWHDSRHKLDSIWLTRGWLDSKCNGTCIRLKSKWYDTTWLNVYMTRVCIVMWSYDSKKAKKQKFSVNCGGYRLSPEKERREKENQKFEDACWMSLVKCCLILSLKVQGLIHPRLSQWSTQWWKYLGNLGMEAAKHFILCDAMMIDDDMTRHGSTLC